MIAVYQVKTKAVSTMTRLMRRKRHPVAVMIHDGYEWHVYVYRMDGGAWSAGASAAFPGLNPHQVPDEASLFARKAGARRVRLLIPNEIYTIAIELPQDHEPEEAHTALAFELEGETSLEAHAMRLAAVRADRFRMGGGAATVLATAFENGRLEAFDAACRAQGLAFEGVGPFELAVLNYHARHYGQSRCLLLRQQNCLYAVPETASLPFAVQMLSFVFTPDESATHPERYERIVRRFKTQAGLPVIVWSPLPPDNERMELIRAALGEETSITVMHVHDHTAEIALHAASAPRVGTLFNGCALVGKGEKPKDPHRAGTWMFLAIVTLCAAALGMQYLNLQWDLRAACSRDAAWKALEQQRKSLAGRADGMKKERDELLAIERELTQNNRLPKGLLPLLEMLTREMPVYTRLTKLYETAGGVLVLEGSTFYQQAIDRLTQSMCRVVQPLGLRIDPGAVTGDESGGELKFTYRIVSAQEGLQ